MRLRVGSLALTGCPCPQNGGECLRAYVSVALEQVARWRDEQGHSGLWYVMRVVSQLLDPRTSEFTAAFVGRLVSTLIARAGRELGESLDQILRAVLSKMQQAETLSVMQVRERPRGALGLRAGALSRCPLSPSPSSWCSRTWCTHSWSRCWSSSAASRAPPASPPWSS